MKIFCFPYAGGSSSVFAKWRSYMPRDIEIVAPELAGRGARFKDEPIRPYSQQLMIFTTPCPRTTTGINLRYSGTAWVVL